MHWMKILKFCIILFLPNFLLGVLFGYFLLDNLYEPLGYYLLLELIGSFITVFVVYVFVKGLPSDHTLNTLALAAINYIVPLAPLVYFLGLEYFSIMVAFGFVTYCLSVFIGHYIAIGNKKRGKEQRA